LFFGSFFKIIIEYSSYNSSIFRNFDLLAPLFGSSNDTFFRHPHQKNKFEWTEEEESNLHALQEGEIPDYKSTAVWNVAL